MPRTRPVRGTQEGNAHRRDALAEAGIAKVVALEQGCQRCPEVKPPHHEGYDIESRHTAGGEILRYIEVKSTQVLWDTPAAWASPTRSLRKPSSLLRIN